MLLLRLNSPNNSFSYSLNSIFEFLGAKWCFYFKPLFRPPAMLNLNTSWFLLQGDSSMVVLWNGACISFSIKSHISFVLGPPD